MSVVSDPSEIAEAADVVHAGLDGSDPYFHDSKRRPSEDSSRATCPIEGVTYNPSGGAECRECALAAGRCGELLKYSQERFGEPRWCTKLPAGKFGDSYDDLDRCDRHQP